MGPKVLETSPKAAGWNVVRRGCSLHVCMSSPEGLGLIRLCAAVEKPRAFLDRANRGRGPRPQTLRTSVIPYSARTVLRINCHLRILHAKYLLDSGAAPRPSRIQLLQYRLMISKHSRSRAPRVRKCWHINRRLVREIDIRRRPDIHSQPIQHHADPADAPPGAGLGRSFGRWCARCACRPTA